jgi:hypothetical protein
VLVADANLTSLASELKAAGVPGTLDTLRAQVYLALLAGTPLTTLLPISPDGATPGSDRPSGQPSSRGCSGPGHGGDAAADDHRGNGGSPTASPPAANRAALASRGGVNLTVPLATWLGHASEPGHAAGFGPLDATDARDLAAALAAHHDNRWCLTLTGPTGQPFAHGCARAGPSPPRQRARDGPGTPGRPQAKARDGDTRSRDGTWTFTLTLLDTTGCDHAWQTPAYKPTPALRHLVQIRHATCVFPGCRRPAKQCDADHTIPYDDGGPTCLCNLASLCRRHHQTKQALRWALKQTSPGTMTWTTPSGRQYTVRNQ